MLGNTNMNLPVASLGDYKQGQLFKHTDSLFAKNACHLQKTQTFSTTNKEINLTDTKLKFTTGFNPNESTEFTKLFFSNQNITILQNKIRYTVYQNSGYVISNQSQTELVIIMRAIYLQYSRNPNHRSLYSKEIERLNSIIVSENVPKIIYKLEAYKNYLRDVQESKLVSVPLAESIKGERTFKDLTFFE